MRQNIRKLLGPYLRELRGGGVSAVLARGAGGAFVVNVLGTGINFGVQILLARLLGADSYGDYIYVFTWMNILLLLCKLGMDTAALRFVSTYHGQAEWSLLSGFLQRSTQVVLAASIFVSSATALTVWLLGERLRPELAATFWVACLVLPVLALLWVRASYLQALKHVVLAQAPLLVLRPLLLATGVVLVAVTPFVHMFSAPVAMGADLVAVTGGLMFVIWKWKRISPAPLRSAEAQYQTREWSQTGWSLLLISGLLVVLNQTDVIMIGFYLGTTEAGIYAVASRAAMLTLFGMLAVNTIAAPMFSEFYYQDRMRELQRTITLAARGILAFSLPVSLGMFIFGDFVLGLFGPDYPAGYWPLVILTMGQLVNASVGSVGFLMSMTGHQRQAALVFGGSAVLNVVLNAGLIPVFGLVGSAIATATTTIAWNVILAIYVWKRLGVRATAI